MNHVMNNNVLVQKEKNIKTFFFVKQGMCKAEAIFGSDTYSGEDVVKALLKIDNSGCDKDIT